MTSAKVQSHPRHATPPTNLAATTLRATYHRASLLLNVLFALNVATTPLMAYVSEPWPWAVPAQNTFTNVSFEAFNQGATVLFQSMYNNVTMPPPMWFKKDPTTLTLGARRTLPIPPAEELIGRPYRQLSLLVWFPGSAFFGVGQRDVAYNFFASNDTVRASRTWEMCQYAVLLGVPVADGCIWIEKVTNHSFPHTGDDVFTVYCAVQHFEHVKMCWGKLAYRVGLTVYVVYLLWTKYYRHVRDLRTQLSRLGLVDSQCTVFQIVLGDPSGLIVSEPIVAFVMVFDIWVNASYLAPAVIQVSQGGDLWLLAQGCLYAARCAWGGLLFMCFFTFFVKRLEWEAAFTPVDPAVMTIAAYLYGGPIAALCAATPLMAIFHFLWGIFVPADTALVDTELSAGVLMVSLMFALLPTLYSLAFTKLLRRMSTRPAVVAAAPPTTKFPAKANVYKGATTPQVHDIAFNDIKLRILLARTVQRTVRQGRGGSMHKLFERDPRYRAKPLISLLAVDVFVLCARDAHSTFDRQVRLSLLSLLDVRSADPTLAITCCAKPHRSSVCVLGTPNSCTTSAFDSTLMTCVHRGATPWLM